MELKIFPTSEELGTEAAGHIAALSNQAIDARGRFTVALSGGSLPKIISPALAASQIDWPAWHVFFADERCVPLDHPDSNYRLAKAQLLDQVGIPEAQHYPIDPALEPAAAAVAYEADLRQCFSPPDAEFPAFDLILLGMGEDGHTASLFPNHPLLREQARWVAEIIDSPKPPPERITLTLPLLNQARTVMFIVTGAGKANILPRVVSGGLPSAGAPASLVQPASGDLYWYVDQPAAERVDID